MNEYATLVRLLTRPGDPIGSGVEDMLDALSLPEVQGRHILFKKLSGLDKQLIPLGLRIKFNPVSRVFYLDTSSKVDIDIEDNVLPDRLAATLLVVITLSYQEGGWVSLRRVKKYRRKAMQGLRKDVRELVEKRYLEFDKVKKQVRPGTRVPFEIDYEAFFRSLGEEKTKK